MTANAVPTVILDNDKVRVTEWRFAPGAETGWHRHEMDYVVVPMTTGHLHIDVGEDEDVIAPLTTGQPYYRDAGVEHNVKNGNPFEFVFIEVETKPG